MPKMKISTDLQLASALLKQEQVIAVATETVYGLAGLATSKKARAQIFAVKQRPILKCLPCQFASIEAVRQQAVVSDRAYKVMSKFMPGPLTVVLPKLASSNLVAGSDEKKTIAVRIPQHQLLLKLLREIGVPLLVTSANLSNYPPATSAAQVQTWFGDQLSFLLDDGQASLSSQASTVVDLTTEVPTLLRAGGITLEEIINCWTSQ